MDLVKIFEVDDDVSPEKGETQGHIVPALADPRDSPDGHVPRNNPVGSGQLLKNRGQDLVGTR